MNQRVLVTAGASGIGREIARAFAVQGAVCDIDSKALETLAQEIPAITTVVCDVSSVTTLSTWWKLPSPS
jgi:NAD(P)-dependent dehydrogenase (short-subunit alcohol dehydrogenase family)